MSIDEVKERSGLHLEEDAKKLWWGSALLGIAMIVLGIVALVASAMTGVVSVILVGAFLAVSGFIELFQTFRHGRKSLHPYPVLVGVLAIVTGGLMVWRPLAGLATVTMLLAAYFFGVGLARIAAAVTERQSGWGLDVAYGAIVILLGIFTMASWPLSSLWLVGTLVGIEILSRGAALTALTFEVRRHHRAVTSAA